MWLPSSLHTTLLLLLLSTTLPHSSHGMEIIVGDDPTQFAAGWSDGICYLPINNARPGDTLIFNFFLHNVYRMPSARAMENCDFSTATLLGAASPYRYTITQNDVDQAVAEANANPLFPEQPALFFACEVGSHCFGEQRLRVNLDVSGSTAARDPATHPVSHFVLGASSTACALVRQGRLDPSQASRAGESSCSDPEFRAAVPGSGDVMARRPHYFRSCLGPPLTLTPGGVINQAFVLNFPFPKERRVLMGTRMWEFVQGDLDDLRPVEVKQLYIHHIAGSVVLGNGAENIRQSEEDAAFPLPYGLLSGDIDDRMIFHLIDLRETGDLWLECLECRCKDGKGTYLGFGGSGSEGGEDGPEGGVSCCTNCTDLTGPTIDYRLRYNVTYTELDDLDEPVEPLVMISTDVAPAVDRYVEWDVPAYPALPQSQVHPNDPKVQVLTRTGTLRELFGGFFPGAIYTGQGLMEVHRCIGHLHVAALGMWLYDDLTNELLCHCDVTYGDDPNADQGFLKSVSVTNYDPPMKILADRKVRVVTHYDATELHTGVMGLLFFFVAERLTTVGPQEASLTADLCAAPYCDTVTLLPEGGCRDALPDSLVCSFGGVCSCDTLLSLSDTIGGCSDDGVYMSPFGNVSVSSLCARHCGCQDGQVEELVVGQIEDRIEDECRYAGGDCTRYLANVYACARPWGEGVEGAFAGDDAVKTVVARRGKELALEGRKIGAPSMHRFDEIDYDEEIGKCDPRDFPLPKGNETDVNAAQESGGGAKFHLLYLFPIGLVLLVVGLGLYSRRVRNRKRRRAIEEAEGPLDFEVTEQGETA